MKTIILGGLAALAALSATPAVAQPGSWDRDSFWRGAAEDPVARIDFLQRRIDRSVSMAASTAWKRAARSANWT